MGLAGGVGGRILTSGSFTTELPEEARAHSMSHQQALETPLLPGLSRTGGPGSSCYKTRALLSHKTENCSKNEVLALRKLC